MKERGFSLIEIMVVLAIIAIISGLAIINMRSMRTMIIKAEMNQLQSLFLYLSHVAQAKSKTITLQIDAIGNTYSYLKQRHALPLGIHFGVIGAIAGPPANPQALIASASSYDNGCIHFYPDGTIQSGTLYLNDGQNQTYALTCAVGYMSCLRLYRYAHGWQLVA